MLGRPRDVYSAPDARPAASRGVTSSFTMTTRKDFALELAPPRRFCRRRVHRDR
jgi:hypothetical protein